ncbi:MAG: DUF2914 domain-containing protein, partial [Nitrosomonas sp.]|nr:DUF2914 domain-containing protein [Nitrosomonas sp.]
TEHTPAIAEQNTISNGSIAVAEEPTSTTPVEQNEHLNEPFVVEEDEVINVTSPSIESEPLDIPYVAEEQTMSEPPEPIVEIVEDIEPPAGETASFITTVPGDQSPVIQAQLTSAIHQREPVDEIDHIELIEGASVRIHFFMRLRDLAGQQVSVRWFYQDNEVAKLDLPIGNNEEWRTHANKLLPKTRLGQWHVELHDASNNLLAKRYFTVSNNP